MNCIIIHKSLNHHDSSQSSDGLISEQWSVHWELKVDRLPLEVIVMLNIDVSMDNWLPNVHEHKHWHHWVNESNPVSSRHEVELSISLEWSEWEPPSSSRWLGGESDSLLSKPLNVFVNSALKLWFDFHSLNHLNYLLLLLIDWRILCTNLGKTLSDFVCVTWTHI